MSSTSGTPRIRTSAGNRGDSRQHRPQVAGSGMKVPLTAILGKDVVDVDFESPDYWAWVRRRTYHALVENRGGVDLTTRPGPGLPGPAVSGGVRSSDNAVGG